MRSSRILIGALLLAASCAEGASLPTPSFLQEDHATGGSSSTAVINKPTAATAGDLVIAEVAIGSTSVTATTPSGWTAFTGNPAISGAATSYFYYRKIADADPATWNVTLSGSAAWGGKSALYILPDQTTPVDVTGVSTAGGSTSTPTATGVTTTVANCMVVVFFSADGAWGAQTPPTGTNERLDDGADAYIDDELFASSGATGNFQATMGSSSDGRMGVIAIRPNTTGVRVYLPSSGAPAVSPTYNSGWENTGSAARLAAVFTRGSSAFSSVTISEPTSDTTSGNDYLGRQYSIQVGAQTISGVIQCNLRFSESNAAANMRSQIRVWLADSSGADRSLTLLDFQGNTTSGNPTDEFTTTLHAWNVPRKGDTHTMTSQTANNNDYLVIELGLREHNTSSTARTASMRIGENSATALLRDDADTADNHPFCDFLSGLSAASAGTCSTSIALLGVGCR